MTSRITDPSFTLRIFSPSDLEAYKSIRLEALLQEPRWFGSNYAHEAAFTEAEWQERLNNPRAARFGLYKDDELVGVTGIVIDSAERGTAHFTHSYIRRQYRRLGLSALYYQTRINWALQHGVNTLLVEHHESNKASMAANQKFGFVFTHCSRQTWPDGVTEDKLCYKLMIR